MNKQQALILFFIASLICVGIGLGNLYLGRINAEPETTVSFTPPSEPPIHNRIEVNIPSRKLFLIQGKVVLKEYSIGVGKSKEFMTPIGDFKVEVKDNNPGWTNPFTNRKIEPGMTNPLGTRWIGFHTKKGDITYGIHGTNQPESVGKFVSHGCIRMKIKDAEELFDQIEIGTPIKIRYERFELKKKNNILALTVYPDPYSIKALDHGFIYNLLKQYPEASIDKLKISNILKSKITDSLTASIGNFTQSQSVS